VATPFADPDRDRPPARHEIPAIDEAALLAARLADRLLDAARDAGNARWAAFLAPLPERLRDEEPTALRKTAMAARAAYGPRDSIRDALSDELTVPFLAAIDRLLKVLARHRMRAD
jgi:hypothetical protein